MSKQFKGAFLIDMENQGDKYESIETLYGALKIKSIIVNKQAGYEEI